jgi:putative endonuclease
MKKPAVYIVSNTKNGTLYVGVTSDLVRRIYEHKNHLMDGFTKKYDCINLMYYEIHDNMESAITREKQIKAGSRLNKIRLIEKDNVDWLDLYQNIACHL